MRRHVKAVLRSGRVISEAFQILGRVSRPHQGDTVSPRRGLNIPAAFQILGRVSRLTASIKPLFTSENAG